MEEAQRLINPWVLHLQKLGLELKCPICLQLFNRPVLLPCSHIFCSSCQIGVECAVCKHSYIDREVKPAPFMENIVSIYRNLEATFTSHVIHPVCSDIGKATVQDVNNSSKKENGVTTKEGNSSNDQSTTLQTAVPDLTFGSLETLEKCITPESVKKQEFKALGSSSKVQVAHDKHMEIRVDGVGFIPMEQLSPPLSCSDPNSNHEDLVRYSLKRPAEKDASGGKSNNHEAKRQKETVDRSDDMKTERNVHLETNLSSENVATASCNSETESKKPVSGGQTDQMDLKSNPCAFCQCSKISEGSGALMAYAHGKEVKGNVSNFAKVTYVHEKCTEWAPQIYFHKGTVKNLESEVARASKLKCTSCGKKGAVLGCYVKSCQRTYHVPCAYDIPDCRWDCIDFLLLCPNHVSHKFPKEKKSKAKKQVTEKTISTNVNRCATLQDGGKNLVLCGSALSAEQKFTMVDFARTNGALVLKYWRDNVTHVIAATDANGACTRTLKVLMAILNGKWVVTMEWLKACVDAGRVVNEEPYEVRLDTHGCSGGPTAGRLRALNNAPKLFNNVKFYFVGDFVQAFKSDLLNLVKTAGGTISETKDQLLPSDHGGVELDQATYVVYNADLSICAEVENEDSIKAQRLAAAEGVAQECGSRVVGHTWILESIAACSLLPLTSRV
ncbi:putative [histone H3]-lysine(4) N-trimethyltransferase chromatin regulator PHD family [Helianthus anomalus]